MATSLPLIPLPGTVAIVTGGGRGLGRSITTTLLASGCQVAICGRNAPEVPVSAGTATASFHQCDIRDPAQAKAFVDAVYEQYGRIDIVVNNAGGSPQASAATASPRFSDSIMALNLMGPLHISQAAYQATAGRGTALSIINIASVSGIRPSPGTAVYGAAKAGLLSLTGSLAQEWGPRVRVNAVVVGLVETETAEDTYGSETARKMIADSLPLRRMGNGTDVAAAVNYLASPLSGYVSGAKLNVDGGGERPCFLDLVERAQQKV